MKSVLIYIFLSFSTTTCVAEILKKVIVVARHGNRAPNAPVPYLCPNMKQQLEEFQEPVFSKYGAALSRVGLAENWESGNYLREKYGYLLPNGSYVNDGSSFFFAERMDRNVASILSLIQGLYPEGTGQLGFLKSRPNIVPIMTTMQNLDTLMNLPRDGPCKRTYQGDQKKWIDANVPTILKEYHNLLSQISKACGMNLTEIRSKPLTWTIKNVADAFNFARNEGLDYNVNGLLSNETIQEFIDLSHRIVSEEFFGKNSQVTYWMGRMPEVLLSLARKPTIDDLSKSRFYWPLGLKMSVDADEEQPWEMTVEEYWDRLKIGVFLNHRELMMAIAKMLEIGGKVESDLPAGSMFVFEVYEEDGSSETSLKMKFWKPTQPSAEQKYRGGYVDGNLLDFYGNGSVTELTPKICEGQSKCMWSDYRRALQQWTRRTGSWEEICHASAEPFGPAEGSLMDDDDDMWMSPHERVLQRIIYGFDGRQETVGETYSAAAVASSDTVLA